MDIGDDEVNIVHPLSQTLNNLSVHNASFGLTVAALVQLGQGQLTLLQGILGV